jgi:addiction module RelE/StbE family toxin
MNALLYSPAFTREWKRYARRNPPLAKRIAAVLDQLAIDPHAPFLHTHKLAGDLAGAWACSVAYDLRILFEIKPGSPTEIYLVSLGSHDHVY